MIRLNRLLRFPKTAFVAAALTAFLLSAALQSWHRPPEEKFTNLKVLPGNIPSKDLQRIMVAEFDDGLGVSCSFCHAAAAGGTDLDFASDAKPEKQIARTMMRMTLRMNKKYFNLKHPQIAGPDLVVSCSTCHGGTPVPETRKSK